MEAADARRLAMEAERRSRASLTRCTISLWYSAADFMERSNWRFLSERRWRLRCRVCGVTQRCGQEGATTTRHNPSRPATATAHRERPA